VVRRGERLIVRSGHLSIVIWTDTSVIEQPIYVSEGFIRPEKNAKLARLGQPLTNLTSKSRRTYGRSTLRRSLSLILGLGLFWFVTARISTQQHSAIMDHSNAAIAQTWQFIAPSAAVEQYRARVKRKELDRWIEQERVIAWNRITSNIGPAAGASDGMVIASPSAGQRLTEPDYYVSTSTWYPVRADWSVYMDERRCFDHIGNVTSFPSWRIPSAVALPCSEWKP